MASKVCISGQPQLNKSAHSPQGVGDFSTKIIAWKIQFFYGQYMSETRIISSGQSKRYRTKVGKAEEYRRECPWKYVVTEVELHQAD